MAETLMSDYGQYIAQREAKMALIELEERVQLIDGRRFEVLVKGNAGRLFLSDLEWHWIEEVV